MDIIYRKAEKEDIKILTQLRIEFILAINRLKDDVDLSKIELETDQYYEKLFKYHTHVAWLAADGERVVGMGDIIFYQTMPSTIIPW